MDTATSQGFSILKTNVKFIEGDVTPLLRFMDTYVNKSFKDGVKSKWAKWIEEGEVEYAKSGKREIASYEEIVKCVANNIKLPYPHGICRVEEILIIFIPGRETLYLTEKFPLK